MASVWGCLLLLLVSACASPHVFSRPSLANEGSAGHSPRPMPVTNDPSHPGAEFHREVARQFGFHPYHPPPAFLELPAATRDQAFGGFHGFYLEVAARAHVATQERINRALHAARGGAAGLGRMYAELFARANAPEDDTIAEDTKEVEKVGHELDSDVSVSELTTLRKERDSVCKEFVQHKQQQATPSNKAPPADNKAKPAATATGDALDPTLEQAYAHELDVTKLEKAESESELAAASTCADADAKLQAALNTKNTGKRMSAISKWVNDKQYKRLLPSLHISGMTMNIFPIILGYEDVVDFITGENVFFYYRGGFVGGTSMFGMSVAGYTAMGWKGNTMFQNTGDAYSGFFQCVDVTGGFLFISGAFSVCWSAGEWGPIDEPPADSVPAVARDPQKITTMLQDNLKHGAMHVAKAGARVFKKPTFNAVITASLSVGVGFSPFSFLPNVGADVMQTCYEIFTGSHRAVKGSDGIMDQVKRKITEFFAKAVAPSCFIPGRRGGVTDANKSIQYNKFKSLLWSKISILNPFSVINAGLRVLLTSANRFRSVFVKLPADLPKTVPAETEGNYEQWAMVQIRDNEQLLDCTDTEKARCPVPFAVRLWEKLQAQGAKLKAYFATDKHTALSPALTRFELEMADKIDELVVQNRAITAPPARCLPFAVKFPYPPTITAERKLSTVSTPVQVADQLYCADLAAVVAALKWVADFHDPTYAPNAGACDLRLMTLLQFTVKEGASPGTILVTSAVISPAVEAKLVHACGSLAVFQHVARLYFAPGGPLTTGWSHAALTLLHEEEALVADASYSPTEQQSMLRQMQAPGLAANKKADLEKEHRHFLSDAAGDVRTDIFYASGDYVERIGYDEKCTAHAETSPDPQSVSPTHEPHNAPARIRLAYKRILRSDHFLFDDAHYETCRLRFAQLHYLTVGLQFLRFRQRFQMTVTPAANSQDALPASLEELRRRVDWVRLVAESLATLNADCHQNNPKSGQHRMAKMLRRVLPSLLGMLEKGKLARNQPAVVQEFKDAYKAAKKAVQALTHGKAPERPLLPLKAYATVMSVIDRNYHLIYELFSHVPHYQNGNVIRLLSPRAPAAAADGGAAVPAPANQGWATVHREAGMCLVAGATKLSMCDSVGAIILGQYIDKDVGKSLVDSLLSS